MPQLKSIFGMCPKLHKDVPTRSVVCWFDILAAISGWHALPAMSAINVRHW